MKKLNSCAKSRKLIQSRHNQCLRQHTNRDTDTLAPRGHGRPQAPRSPNAASGQNYTSTPPLGHRGLLQDDLYLYLLLSTVRDCVLWYHSFYCRLCIDSPSLWVIHIVVWQTDTSITNSPGLWVIHLVWQENTSITSNHIATVLGHYSPSCNHLVRTYSELQLQRHRFIRHPVYAARYYVSPMNPSLLTVTLYSSVITPHAYNDTQIYGSFHDVIIEFNFWWLYLDNTCLMTHYRVTYCHRVVWQLENYTFCFRLQCGIPQRICTAVKPSDPKQVL